MNLMFWKKKPEGSDATETSEASSGPLARIKALVAGLTGKLKRPPPFKAEIPASAETESTAGEIASPELDAATEGERTGALAGMKSRLLSLLIKPAAAPVDGEPGEAPARRINPLAVAALLLLLLLSAFGYAVWSIVLSSPDPENGVTELIEDKHANDAPLPIVMPASAPVSASDATAASEVLAASAPAGTDAASAVPPADEHAARAAPSVKAVPAPKAPLTEVEALRQKNAELQAELDALKKGQQSSAAIKLHPGGKGAPAGGVATVGSSDPKAAAATLKEAIELMNNGRNQETPAR